MVIVAAAALLGACARGPRVYHVGILVGADTMESVADGFKAGMTELGYVEGRTISYDTQRPGSDPAEEARIAARFVSNREDLVFAFPGRPAAAVKAAAKASSIPVVFANAVIEGNQLIDSVSRPGGNITGVRVPGPEIVLKSFESLLELSPRVRRVMVIYDPGYPTNPPTLEVLRTAARSGHVTLQEVGVPDPAGAQAVLQGLERSGKTRVDAIMLLQDTITRSGVASSQILRFADAHRVPVAGGPAALVQQGALLSALSNAKESGRLAASLADRILKGTPAGTIPVLSPQPLLIINYARALQLGLTVPESLLKQASQISR